MFKNLINSLNLKDEGWSFRKIISLIALILVIYLHLNYIDSTNVIDALFYDLLFILSLLGLINVDNLIKARYGSREDDKE